MIKRLQNIWKLGQYVPSGTKDEVTLRLDDFVKPKGQAVIIDMETPADMFPEQKDL